MNPFSNIFKKGPKVVEENIPETQEVETAQENISVIGNIRKHALKPIRRLFFLAMIINNAYEYRPGL